jgi:hypothetical protein
MGHQNPRPSGPQGLPNGTCPPADGVLVWLWLSGSACLTGRDSAGIWSRRDTQSYQKSPLDFGQPRAFLLGFSSILRRFPMTRWVVRMHDLEGSCLSERTDSSGGWIGR